MVCSVWGFTNVKYYRYSVGFQIASRYNSGMREITSYIIILNTYTVQWNFL